MNPIRILLVDDHSLFRAGMRALLEHLPHIHVVAEAGDGREALRLIKTHQPQVVVMDIGMKGLNGIETTAQITKDFPQVRVLILSIHAEEQYVVRALNAGAAGYLSKGAAVGELEQALTTLGRGESYLSQAVSQHIVAGYQRQAGKEVGGEQVLNEVEELTGRQREILQLIAEGQSTKQMAILLHLSEKTVDTHRTQLMKRLNIHNVAGLVRYAIRNGLATLDP